MYTFNKIFIGVLVLLSLTAATCEDANDDGNGSDNLTADIQAELAGRTFLSVEVVENAVVKNLVAGTFISLKFYENGRLSAHAGCNGIEGNFEIVGGVLQMEMIWITDMGCDQARHAQDEWLSDVLSANPAITLVGDDLTLEATLEGGTLVKLTLRDEDVTNPDRTLVGTQWIVDTLIDGSTARNGIWDTPAQILFKEDGTISFFDGCNSGSGSYTLNGDKITVGADLLSTTMACEEEGITSLETHVHAVLQNEVTFEIDNQRLTLTNGDKALGCIADDQPQ